MTISRSVFAGFVLLSILLTSCGGDGQSQTGDAAAPAQETPVDFDMLLANADTERGKMMYFQCRACHSLLEGAPNKVGPNLHGMFGSKAGFAPGFAYSEAMTGSDVVWTPENVDQWLASPSEFMPGNRMVFVGIKRPADRASLIAYLQSQTNP